MDAKKTLITTKMDIILGYIISTILLCIGFAFSSIEHSFAYIVSIFFITIGCMIMFFVYLEGTKIIKTKEIKWNKQ